MGEFEEPDIRIRERTSARDEALSARACGDHESALEHFRQAVAGAPEKAWMLLDVGEELLRLERLGEAVAVYLEAVTRDPLLAKGFRGLGLIARRRGDREEAARRFQEATAVEPDNIWLWFDLASELREQGRLDEAADAYRKMLGGDPKVFHAWRGLALIARQRGDRAEALDCFRVAAIFNPSDIWAVQDVAAEFRELGRFESSPPPAARLWPSTSGSPRPGEASPWSRAKKATARRR